MNVYAVVSAYMADYYIQASRGGDERKGDRRFRRHHRRLESALSVIEERPCPHWNSTDTPARRVHVRFDATGSYSVSSEIVKWDWDWGR